MKLKTMMIVGVMVGVIGFANAKSQLNVYSPEQGVICDKKSGFCSDSFGIPIAFTKEFLGQKQADNFTKILSDR